MCPRPSVARPRLARCAHALHKDTPLPILLWGGESTDHPTSITAVPAHTPITRERRRHTQTRTAAHEGNSARLDGGQGNGRGRPQYFSSVLLNGGHEVTVEGLAEAAAVVRRVLDRAALDKDLELLARAERPAVVDEAHLSLGSQRDP